MFLFRIPAVSFSSDKAEIITNQCEAYEVMKLQKQPSRGQTTSGTAIEQTYEEVGEGLTSLSLIHI